LSALDNVSLEQYQCHRSQQGKKHNAKADAKSLQWTRVKQTLHRLQNQVQRRSGNEGCLCQPGNGLGLAVAKTMLLIRGLQGVTHRQQIDK
jgi:hypothetical protein